jgi:hypothetical protein
MSAPDVSAIAPQVATIPSDLPQTQIPSPSTPDAPNPAAAPVAAATTAPPGSIWKSVLQGALAGLAGSAGSTHFGGGLAKGAAGEIGSQIQQHQQSQADQEQASQIKFRDLQSAKMAVDLSHLDQQFQNQDQSAQDSHQDHVDQWAKFNRDNWGTQYDVVPNGHDATTNYLNQSAAQDPTGTGAHIPEGTLVGPHQMYVPKVDATSPQQHLAKIQDLATVTNSPAPSQEQFNRMNPGQQDAAAAGMQRLAMGRDENGKLLSADAIPGAISNLQAGLKTYQQNPNADPQMVTLIKGTIGNLAGQLDSANKAKTARAVSTANAEMPGKIATVTAEAKAKDAISGARKDNDPVVAYDPAQGNVVTTRAQAEEAGQFHYKADPAKINATVAGMNDVQVKLNQLADIATSPKMSQVQTGLAGALLEAKGIQVGVAGTYIPTGRVNAGLYSENIGKANQATRDFVTATLAAHEAITQLPRLQTFGQSSRMTQQQMEAAQQMLPVPGDDSGMSQQKMDSLQGTIDPLRKQIPKMPGAPLVPSYRERQR